MTRNILDRLERSAELNALMGDFDHANAVSIGLRSTSSGQSIVGWNKRHPRMPQSQVYWR